MFEVLNQNDKMSQPDKKLEGTQQQVKGPWAGMSLMCPGKQKDRACVCHVRRRAETAEIGVGDASVPAQGLGLSPRASRAVMSPNIRCVHKPLWLLCREWILEAKK